MKQALDVRLKKRINWVLIVFALLFAGLIGRFFLLQIVYHRTYLDLAARQQTNVFDSTPERGSIFMNDKTGIPVPLAENRAYKTLIVSPKLVIDTEGTAAYLADMFGLDKDKLIQRFSDKNDEYEVVGRKIKQNMVDIIAAKQMPGVFFQEEKLRFYPHTTMTSQLIGFVSREKDKEEGRYGLEQTYEKQLIGSVSASPHISNPSGFLSMLGRSILHPAQNGADIYTTIDYTIQLKTEEILAAVKQAWQAPSGLAVVMEPKTGRILAMANLPSFDPNNFSKEKNFSVFLNNTIQAAYELGSVVKPITMSAALEERVVSPNTTYTDTGEVQFGHYTIRNFDEQAYGVQTMTQVIEKSLNIGMVFVSRLLGKEKELDYFKRFGLGQKTGIDLVGELSGNISSLANMRDIDFASAAFGQGISVTPLQVASAISAIANHGVLMQPYVIDRITDDSGNSMTKSPKEIRRVISPETSEEMTKMLIGVVRNSFEKKAAVKGYFVAGKTGTAQIAIPGVKGYSDKVIHTFVGYAPAFDPKFLILLELVDPIGNKFAANTLTPAFHDLAQFILNYYEIPPDEK